MSQVKVASGVEIYFGVWGLAPRTLNADVLPFCWRILEGKNVVDFAPCSGILFSDKRET